MITRRPMTPHPSAAAALLALLENDQAPDFISMAFTLGLDPHHATEVALSTPGCPVAVATTVARVRGLLSELTERAMNTPHLAGVEELARALHIMVMQDRSEFDRLAPASNLPPRMLVDAATGFEHLSSVEEMLVARTVVAWGYGTSTAPPAEEVRAEPEADERAGRDLAGIEWQSADGRRVVMGRRRMRGAARPAV